MSEKSRAEKLTEEMFLNGPYNCAQTAFCAFANKLGIDESTALRVSAAFGGGVARNGELCGAVTGALMAIGANYARPANGEPPSKEAVYGAANEFINEFKRLHGSIICRELLEADISTPEGKEKAAQTDSHRKICPRFVSSAIDIAEKLI